jgi:hypothetical protein
MGNGRFGKKRFRWVGAEDYYLSGEAQRVRLSTATLMEDLLVSSGKALEQEDVGEIQLSFDSSSLAGTQRRQLKRTTESSQTRAQARSNLLLLESHGYFQLTPIEVRLLHATKFIATWEGQ